MQAEDDQLITYAMYQIPISPARDTNVKKPWLLSEWLGIDEKS